MLNFGKYSFYVIDTETTNLDDRVGDVIEASFIRLNDGVQKTWFIKPTNFEGIDDGALRVNGHKKEDITWKTKHGKDTYIEAETAIVQIENWIMEDEVSSEDKIIVGHNANFDKNYLYQMWKKCNSEGTFPFGRRLLDTMQIELMILLLGDSDVEGLALSNLVKKYGVKNEKAHTAEADTKATKEVLIKQIEYLKSKLNA